MNHQLLDVKQEARRLYDLHLGLVDKKDKFYHSNVISHCKNSIDLAKRANPELKDFWHDLNMEISYMEPLV